jgi:hypothetical protein
MFVQEDTHKSVILVNAQKHISSNIVTVASIIISASLLVPHYLWLKSQAGHYAFNNQSELKVSEFQSGNGV